MIDQAIKPLECKMWKKSLKILLYFMSIFIALSILLFVVGVLYIQMLFTR